jgi:hypothetical protein
MINVAAAINAAQELDKCVGMIASVVGKLKTKPDLAAEKLGQALLEVGKTLQSVDDVAAAYLALGIDDQALKKRSERLLQIEGGSLTTEMHRGLGHCHVIGRIHATYLDKWFKRTFDNQEYSMISAVFGTLQTADGGLFDVLASVASTLETEAAAVLDLVIQGDEAAARARVLSSLPALRPLRKTMSKTMAEIYSLHSEFMDISGAV